MKASGQIQGVEKGDIWGQAEFVSQIFGFVAQPASIKKEHLFSSGFCNTTRATAAYSLTTT